jgi:hypothetical protein
LDGLQKAFPACQIQCVWPIKSLAPNSCNRIRKPRKRKQMTKKSRPLKFKRLPREAPRGAKPIEIKAPLLIMFENDDGSITCHIHPAPDWNHETYGLLITDMVRYIAKAFKVDEDKVWEMVDAERYHPTDRIEQAS